MDLLFTDKMKVEKVKTACENDTRYSGDLC